MVSSRPAQSVHRLNSCPPGPSAKWPPHQPWDIIDLGDRSLCSPGGQVLPPSPSLPLSSWGPCHLHGNYEDEGNNLLPQPSEARFVPSKGRRKWRAERFLLSPNTFLESNMARLRYLQRPQHHRCPDAFWRWKMMIPTQKHPFLCGFYRKSLQVKVLVH